MNKLKKPPPSASVRLTSAPKPDIPFPAANFPELYGMKLSGACLQPELMHGDEVVFSSVEPPVVGDFAIFIVKPELVEPGELQTRIKRLVTAIPPWVTFPYRDNPRSDVRAIIMAEQLNPRGMYSIRCDTLLAVHKFVRVQNRAVAA